MSEKTKKDMQPIDEEYIASVINQEIDSSDSWMNGDLGEEQAKNLDYYYGEPFGNEEDGFSSVITRDVLETVEGILPDLMKIFCSGDNVAEFDPVNPADEDRVKIQMGYINHVFMNRYNGYKLLYDWFKDALLMKNGIIKVGWNANETVQFKEFRGLTKEEFKLLKEGESEDEDLLGTEYEIDSYTEMDDDTYEVRLKVTSKKGQPDIVTIPSEDFRIKERSTCLKSTSFAAHVMSKTRGELIEMGYDEDDITDAVMDNDDFDESAVPQARYKNPDETALGKDVNASSYDENVEFIEAWVRLYDQEDERVKLYHVFQVGKTCLEYEEVDRIPLISLSPIMMPHKFSGIAVADLVRDIQEIRSVIYRQMLDNLALQNAGRYTAIEGQVNLQDLIDNKIGGIIRQKMPGAVDRLATPDLSQFTIPTLELLDVQKENRTGVSRMTAGLDESALASHQTAGAVNQVMSAAQGKIQLIARNFAETGVKDLFVELYNQIREHQDLPDLVPLAGRYAIVNPSEWIDRNDIHVTVGIGNGNKDQQLFHLSQINQMLSAIQQSKFGYLITADNVFYTASEFIKNSGYHNPERFISNPTQVEEPPPPPNPQLIAAQAQMMEAQTNQGYKGGQIKVSQGELMLDREKQDWQKKVDAVEASLEASQERPVGVGRGK